MIEVASSDGATVVAHDMGGAGEPLLICHATGFHARAYEPMAAELAPHFHVWGIDFRGHGDATPPENHRFDWGGFADDLLNVADAIGSGPITVFGHSLGGGVTLLAELRQPGTVRAAYLFEPIVIPAVEGTMPGGPSSMSGTARHRRASFPSRADALHRYASRPPLNQLRADSLFCYVEHGFRDMPDGTVSLKCTPDSEASCFEGAGKPTVELAHDVKVPITIAIGTVSEGWTPARFGAAVADALPNGRLEQHSMLGHFGPLQDPVSIAQSVLASDCHW